MPVNFTATNTTAWVFVESVTHNSTFFGLGWLFGIALMFILMIIITRDVKKWPVLAFPVLMSLRTVGLDLSFIVYMLAAIAFVGSTLGQTGIHTIIRSTTRTGESVFREFGFKSQEEGRFESRQKSIIEGNRMLQRERKKGLKEMEEIRLHGQQLRRKTFETGLPKREAISDLEEEELQKRIKGFFRKRKTTEKDRISFDKLLREQRRRRKNL